MCGKKVSRFVLAHRKFDLKKLQGHTKKYSSLLSVCRHFARLIDIYWKIDLPPEQTFHPHGGDNFYISPNNFALLFRAFLEFEFYKMHCKSVEVLE